MPSCSVPLPAPALSASASRRARSRRNGSAPSGSGAGARQGPPPRARAGCRRAGRKPARPPCAGRSRHSPWPRSTLLAMSRSMARKGLSAAQAWRLARTMAAAAAIGQTNGFRSDIAHRCTRSGCRRRRVAAMGSVDSCLDRRSGQLLVQPRIHLGQLPDHLEGPLAFAVAAQRDDIGDAALLEAGDIAIGHQRLGPHARLLVVDQHLIKAGGQRLDKVEQLDEAGVLLPGNGAGDEDAEMPDLGMHAVDDRLPLRDQVVIRGIEVEDPVERLLRRGDVVTPGDRGRRSASGCSAGRPGSSRHAR